MVSVIWAPRERPSQRHVIVHVHRDGMPVSDKGYFFFSDENDWGGSGPFDMHLDEVIERAKRAASEQDLESVVIVRRT